jgi:hypothetical protein
MPSCYCSADLHLFSFLSAKKDVLVCLCSECKADTQVQGVTMEKYIVLRRALLAGRRLAIRRHYTSTSAVAQYLHRKKERLTFVSLLTDDKRQKALKTQWDGAIQRCTVQLGLLPPVPAPAPDPRYQVAPETHALAGLTVEELKGECHKREISASGTKIALLIRLNKAILDPDAVRPARKSSKRSASTKSRRSSPAAPPSTSASAPKRKKTLSDPQASPLPAAPSLPAQHDPPGGSALSSMPAAPRKKRVGAVASTSATPRNPKRRSAGALVASQPPVTPQLPATKSGRKRSSSSKPDFTY